MQLMDKLRAMEHPLQVRLPRNLKSRLRRMQAKRHIEQAELVRMALVKAFEANPTDEALAVAYYTYRAEHYNGHAHG